jgi:hypothetical protein
MQRLRVSEGKLAVCDSSTRGHQVQLAWFDVLNCADAVAMFESAFDHPSRSLQAGMRVSCNHHAFILGCWAEVVGKSPGANHALPCVWQRSTHLDSGSGRELHVPRLKQHF